MHFIWNLILIKYKNFFLTRGVNCNGLFGHIKELLISLQVIMIW